MQYDIFPAAYMDSLRDKMIANNGGIPKSMKTGETTFEDQDAGFGFNTMGKGFAKAYMESWARLATSIGWTVEEVHETESGREAMFRLVNQKSERFSLSTMIMYGCSASISFTWLGGNGVVDGSKRNMYDLLNGGSHNMLHRIEERLWYWVNKTPKPKPFKMNAVYEEQQRYILNKLDKVRKKNGLAGVK